MKKTWMVAMLIVAGLIVGCGNGDETDTPTPDTSTAAP